MAYDAPLDEIIPRLVGFLDAAAVPYMLTGSLASSLHGTPRSTQDIDFVIAPDEAGLERLLSSFPDDRYYVSREAARGAFRQSSLFNVIDLASGWKIDFIFRKPREFSRVEFGRRIAAEVQGVVVSVAAPEDVILAKLEWAKRSGSERQIEDAAGVLRAQGASLDMDYLERWVAVLELDEVWAAARARMK
ncbi:MAG TPA: hypothetical protein VLT84_09590 [Acidobacteriota bacterium]|nr:hypothetical protein [Acidobacteriota bacterium]